MEKIYGFLPHILHWREFMMERRLKCKIWNQVEENRELFLYYQTGKSLHKNDIEPGNHNGKDSYIELYRN